MDVLYWIGMAPGFVFLGFIPAGFWRGLSLKPTYPETRAPERPTWLIGPF